MKRLRIFLFTTLLIIMSLVLSMQFPPAAMSATMKDYSCVPPFVSQSVPPLVMFLMDRSHKLYYQAYNDASDLDEDGRLDTTYKHSIEYYGYFDPDKCYTYSSTGTGRFVPDSAASNKFCSSGKWSGNVLNWLTMSRMDVLKKVLYGGQRVTDSNSSTVLERVFVPQDAHSWGKEFTGRLCSNGSDYTNMCSTSEDCDTGYTCVDRSQNLVGFEAAAAPQPCSATGISWGGNGNPGKNKILVAKYTHSGTTCGSDHTDLENSYEPANLVSGFPKYVDSFDDTILDPTNDHGNLFNYFVVA
jgi:type IV pilus assembly protein PilY1